MNGLWKKRVSAFIMALVMIVSLMPMALADEVENQPQNPDQKTEAEDLVIIQATETQKAGTAMKHTCIRKPKLE